MNMEQKQEQLKLLESGYGSLTGLPRHASQIFFISHNVIMFALVYYFNGLYGFPTALLASFLIVSTIGLTILHFLTKHSIKKLRSEIARDSGMTFSAE